MERKDKTIEIKDLENQQLQPLSEVELEGVVGGNTLSFVVSNAGDINGDGIDDLIIGAPYASPNGSFSGESYVVFRN